MKALFALALIVMSVSPAFAVEKCKFHLNDLTKDELVSTGATRDEALEKAANKCFSMYEEASLRRTGRGLANDDAGVTIVNMCTNVRCS